MTPTFLAVDVGGTKVAVGRVTAGGRVLDRRQLATAEAMSADDLFDRIISAVSELGRHDGVDIGCGVGSAGPVLDGGAVSPLNIPLWRKFPLKARLEDRLSMPVAIEVDGHALARAEGWVGQATGSANYLSLVVSTGVGGGLVLDGRLIAGRTGNAGHIGHVRVVDRGRPCVCGGNGCLEAEVSGRAIERATGRPPSDAPPEMRERCGRLVGRAAGSLANVLDLDLVTLSGGVALGFGAPFVAAARIGAAETATLAFARPLRIEASTLGPDGPLLGAAAIALAHADPDVLA